MKDLQRSAITVIAACLTLTGFIGYAGEDIIIKEAEDVTVSTPLDGMNIKVDAGRDLTTESNLKAQNAVELNAGNKISIKDSVTAGGKINIKAGGGVTVSGTIKSGGDVKITSGGNIDIDAPIEGKRVDTKSAADTNIGADVTGHEGVTITTEGDGELNVSPTSTINSPKGKVKLNSAHPNVEGQVKEGSTK